MVENFKGVPKSKVACKQPAAICSNLQKMQYSQKITEKFAAARTHQNFSLFAFNGHFCNCASKAESSKKTKLMNSGQGMMTSFSNKPS
jgi:hypothetical protein